MRAVYHLHAAPVPADGNCTGTLGHVDPFIRGEVSIFLFEYTVQDTNKHSDTTLRRVSSTNLPSW